MTNRQLDAWRGDFGNAYIERNLLSDEVVRRKTAEWAQILKAMGGQAPRSILEVGSNVGHNLAALDRLSGADLFAVEPNAKARQQLAGSGILPADHVVDAVAMSLPFEDASMDLVFTSGVLIHVSPDDLAQACREIHRVSRRFVLAIEYFSDQPTEKPYRGHDGLLYLRDFGSFWLDQHADLEIVDYGFFWKRIGVDNLNWWLFQKRS